MIAIVTLGLTLIIAVVLIYGSRRWESATREMHARLEAARLPVGRAQTVDWTTGYLLSTREVTFKVVS